MMNGSDTIEPRKSFWGIRPRLLIGFLAVGLAIALLVWRGAENSMVYYITVSELMAKERGQELDGLRVTGMVVPGSIESEPLHLRFRMTDGVKAVPVEYRGVIPDTFGEQGEVVVEGSYTTSGIFEANYLMAKCPSKYEMSPDEVQPESHPESARSS
jgi:cytochrome c-type biogenesis protein CcmE